MNILIILLAKLVSFIGKPLGRATSLPGVIAYKLNKKIFRYFKIDVPVIVVTGSSGKGSSSSLIAYTLRKLGYKVAYNDSGSNLSYAVLTTIINNSNIFGKTKADYFVFEMDERYTRFVFADMHIDYLLITNITRDQPPRQYNTEVIYNIINKAIKPESTLILNADDPYVYRFGMDRKAVWFSLKDKDEYSKLPQFKHRNIDYCPICNSELTYNGYIFENHGDYSCPNCDFKRPDAQFNISKVDYDKLSLDIDGKDVSFIYPTLFDVYNTAGVYALLRTVGIDDERIREAFKTRIPDKKIYEHYKYHGRDVKVINNKNENSTTFNQAIRFVARNHDNKDILIGWKEISRRYLFNDVSWLYDLDFELLADSSVNKILCVGIQRYDIALALKYAGLEDRILIYEDLGEAVEYLKNESDKSVYAVVNFDYVEPFKELMRETSNED